MIAGDIDALAVLDDAALVYAANDAVGIDLLDHNGNQTVVKQQLSADRGAALVEEDVDELRVGNRNSVEIALIALLVECEIRAFLQGRLSVGKGSDSDLWSLGVEKDSDVLSALGDRLTDRLENDRQVLVGAVRHIDSGNVHARVDHLEQHRLCIAGRAYRADNFCFSHSLSPFRIV